jgi:hypothetical protein
VADGGRPLKGRSVAAKGWVKEEVDDGFREEEERRTMKGFV